MDVCGALGGFVGSYAVGALNAMTGNTHLSFGLMAGALLLASVLIALAPGRRAG